MRRTSVTARPEPGRIATCQPLVTAGRRALIRQVVNAFLAPAGAGDFDALLRVLDPDVVFRMDLGPASRLAHRPLVGADAVARQVLATAPRFAHLAQPVLVNGEPAHCSAHARSRSR